MIAREQSSNRKYIYHYLKRSLQYHANVGGTCEIDVTDLMSALQAVKDEGEPVGLVPALIKATGIVMSRNPRLNRRLFHGVFRKYEVQYKEANCSVLVRRRGPDGEDLLLTVNFMSADKMDVRAIAKKLRHCKTAPLDEIPEYQGVLRAQGLSDLQGAWLNFKARSDHKFISKLNPATYGLSSLAGGSRVAFTPTQTISPYCATFFPSTLNDRAWVVDGKVQVRKILGVTLTMDHYLIDGGDGVLAVNQLAELLSDPSSLGL